jgi:excisionase family DNA binding protein
MPNSDPDASMLKPLLVDTPTAARLLGVSPRTIWSLANRGEIRATRIGRAVRFEPRQLEKFIAEQQGGDK